MELDELKTAWQSLDRRLEQHNRLNLQLFRDGRLESTRKSLRPLSWGQLAQMLFGLPFVLLAGFLWYRAGSVSLPLALPTLLAGICVQVYGIATLALAGATLGKVRSLDYAAPVVEIQRQLAELRRLYIVNGMIAGLPWWFLWVPVLMVLAGLGGVDLYAKAPGMVWMGLGVGAVGLLATAWFHRWSRDPRRPRLAKAVEDSVTGGSLRKAGALIEEIARFEKE